jgi:hypothetical protein
MHLDQIRADEPGSRMSGEEYVGGKEQGSKQRVGGQSSEAAAQSWRPVSAASIAARTKPTFMSVRLYVGRLTQEVFPEGFLEDVPWEKLPPEKVGTR